MKHAMSKIHIWQFNRFSYYIDFFFKVYSLRQVMLLLSREYVFTDNDNNQSLNILNRNKIQPHTVY